MDVGCGLIALVPSTKWGNKLGLALCWHDLCRLSANGDDLSVIQLYCEMSRNVNVNGLVVWVVLVGVKWRRAGGA